MNPDQTADSSSHCNKTFYHNQKEIIRRFLYCRMFPWKWKCSKQSRYIRTNHDCCVNIHHNSHCVCCVLLIFLFAYLSSRLYGTGANSKVIYVNKIIKNMCFFTENIVFGVSRPRSLQPTSGFSIWSDPGDRHFWGHPTTQYWPKSPPLFWPFPVPARPPCLPVDRSDPGPPDLCGHSCVRPLTCPNIPIF